ncbi:unnamed protein product [Notodromas monacha]|uniref:Angiotensin-converting enzyme n=1 Tax=Notodromas monacha TaxID=399045 RepID=A0A7R9GFW3_9CRUS|nr:unnamed protein product [Notodromas monacha]CAG0921092.1 unnamed protein product [Notodromas monacha]
MLFLFAILVLNPKLTLAEQPQDEISKLYLKYKQAKYYLGGSEPLEAEEKAARNFFATWDLLQSNVYYPYVIADWNYQTNMTEENLNAIDGEGITFGLKMEELTKIAATAFGKRGPFARWRNYHDSYFVRLIWKQLGSATLESEAKKFAEKATIDRLEAEMGKILVEAQICSSNGEVCGIKLNPDVTDPEERKHLWKAWFDATGKKIRPLYEQYVVLLKERAKALGYPNAAEMMMAPEETPDLRGQVLKLWIQAQPLYKKIFSYFRFKLSNVYPGLIDLNGPIPAHFMGYPNAAEMMMAPEETPDLRGQVLKLWIQAQPLYKKIFSYFRFKLSNVYPGLIDLNGPIPAHFMGSTFPTNFNMVNNTELPYPGSENIWKSIAEEMLSQGYTVRRMYDVAEDFFVSMGFSPMTKTFFEKSLFEKPDDGREVTCHGSAHDFNQGACGDDFRIKYCAEVTPGDLATIHHEMGHIQYFMSYSHLPTQFRDGANSGFHEAIGDTMSLSSSSMKHLQKIGLLKPGRFSSQEIAEKDINILLTKASSTFGQLGFAYSLDLWRWDVLGNDSVTNKNMNKAYWDHVERLMGIKPMPRTEEDLDPGAIYHVANGVSYIRYFMSIILQHQFHEAMCKAAGEYDPNKADKPLHNCDFYKSKPAGDLLRKAMHLGSSKPWPLVLEKITGQKTMTADSLKRFYKPLERFLDKFLAENKQCIGWGSDCNSGRSAHGNTTFKASTFVNRKSFGKSKDFLRNAYNVV